MNKNNILVTGGFGILGRSLIRQLLVNKKNNIFLLDRSSNKKKFLHYRLKIKILKLSRETLKITKLFIS